jgi:hypothetical protein
MQKTKVLIDAFDTEEQAVAFVNWLSKRLNGNACRLVTTDGVWFPYFDGVDTNSEFTCVNIVMDDDNED